MSEPPQGARLLTNSELLRLRRVNLHAWRASFLRQARFPGTAALQRVPRNAQNRVHHLRQQGRSPPPVMLLPGPSAPLRETVAEQRGPTCHPGRIILSWFRVNLGNPIVRSLYEMTEPCTRRDDDTPLGR